MDKGVNLLHNYFKLVKDAPEFFACRDVYAKEVQSCMEYQKYILLPHTPDNYNVVFFKLSDYQPKNFVFNDVVRSFLMTVGMNYEIEISNEITLH